jgi:hypothetical protein
MQEKTIEKALIDAVKQHHGLCLKWVCPAFAGVPDRIILLPHSRIAFAELKAPGKKMRPLQQRRKAQLEQLGFKVYCIDSISMIEGVIHEIQTT